MHGVWRECRLGMRHGVYFHHILSEDDNMDTIEHNQQQPTADGASEPSNGG